MATATATRNVERILRRIVHEYRTGGTDGITSATLREAGLWIDSIDKMRGETLSAVRSVLPRITATCIHCKTVDPVSQAQTLYECPPCRRIAEGTTIYQVIGRGKAGWHASGRYAWGDTPDRVSDCSSSGGTFDGYVTQAEPGALVYDADASPYDVFARLVISWPMVKHGLGAYQWESIGRCGEYYGPYDLDAMKQAGIHGLTYIGIGIFEALLRRVPNLRIGYVTDPGIVTWNDGGPSPA